MLTNKAVLVCITINQIFVFVSLFSSFRHAGVYRNILRQKRIVNPTFLPQGAARKPSVSSSLWLIKSSSPVKNPLHLQQLMNSSRSILFSVSLMIFHSKICTLFSRLQSTELMLALQVRAQG